MSDGQDGDFAMSAAHAGSSGEALALAATVHDGPLQLLAVAVQELCAERADVPRAEQLVRRAMGELRGLLQPPPLTVAVADVRGTFSWWAELVLAQQGPPRACRDRGGNLLSPPYTPGWDIAGVVESVGFGVTRRGAAGLSLRL